MTNTVTRLFYKGRLIATITPNSTFFGFNPPKDMHKPEVRRKCAELIKQGWVGNAHYNPQDFTIEEGKPDPMVVSAMTDDIIRRSREGHGT